MDKKYQTLENTIRSMSEVPMLNGTDWRYSRICNSIRNMYEKTNETRQEADEKGYDEDDMRLKTGSDQEKIELRRNKKTQQKTKIIDVEGN